MTIRYEANPPKIQPHINSEQESISKFVDKIKDISQYCDAVHLTENVLGFQRISPIKIGRIIKKEIPTLPITISLRTRDKTQTQIQEFVKECIAIGFSGILVLMGDPAQQQDAQYQRNNSNNNNQVPPSSIVKKLCENAKNTGAKIDLYLSVPNNPNIKKIDKKINANPKGFMTQVIQSVNQAQNLKKVLQGFSVIPIVLFPSQKNEKSAKFLNLDIDATHTKNFGDFVNKVHDITGDILITSPNDFNGLKEFLKDFR